MRGVEPVGVHFVDEAGEEGGLGLLGADGVVGVGDEEGVTSAGDVVRAALAERELGVEGGEGGPVDGNAVEGHLDGEVDGVGEGGEGERREFERAAGLGEKVDAAGQFGDGEDAVVGVAAVVVGHLGEAGEAVAGGLVVDVGADDGADGFEGALGAVRVVEEVDVGEVDEEGAADPNKLANEGEQEAEHGQVVRQVHAEDGRGVTEPAKEAGGRLAEVGAEPGWEGSLREGDGIDEGEDVGLGGADAGEKAGGPGTELGDDDARDGGGEEDGGGLVHPRHPGRREHGLGRERRVDAVGLGVKGDDHGSRGVQRGRGSEARRTRVEPSGARDSVTARMGSSTLVPSMRMRRRGA